VGVLDEAEAYILHEEAAAARGGFDFGRLCGGGGATCELVAEC
jgi:hypothetical protein